jgi:diguanylate cyclase (GGDEF)-like protein
MCRNDPGDAAACPAQLPPIGAIGSHRASGDAAQRPGERMYRLFRLVSSPQVLCTAFAATLWVMFEYDFNLPTRIGAFAAAHANWHVGTILTMMIVSRLFVSILVIRWAIALHHEILLRREAERKALLLAHNDPLTGLPNRRVFKEVLGETLAALGPDESVGVMFVDFDGFKSVNDFYGHAIGDEVLCEGADRLRAAIGDERMLSRLGGDEFAIMCEVGASPARLERIASCIVAAFAEPFECRDRKIKFGASVGIAIAPKDGADVTAVLRAADEAMYRAKKAGKGRFRLFEPDSNAQTRGRAELKAELHDAIAAGQIVPYYQPLIDIAGNRICGLEALARWRHPHRGVLSPDAFMPMIEDMNLSSRMTLSLLAQICADAKMWPAHYRIAMNLSLVALHDAAMLHELCQTIMASGIPPGRFEMEIIEPALIDNLPAACSAIDGLRAQGISVVLDDFGNGYSSLHHLRSLHFDKVKIDRPFVGSIEDDARGADYVRAVIGLGTSLQMEVAAEGIETPAVLARLAQMGCRFGQGFLFAQPLPAEALAMMLKAALPPRGESVGLKMAV